MAINTFISSAGDGSAGLALKKTRHPVPNYEMFYHDDAPERRELASLREFSHKGV
jgi:hypothetical protein